MAGTLQFDNDVAITAENTLDNPEIIAGYTVKKLFSTDDRNSYYLAEKNGNDYFLKISGKPLTPSATVKLEKLKSVYSNNIAKVVEYGDYKGRAYEVQKYYEGITLDKVDLSVSDIAEKIVPQVNKALSDIHSVNLVHSDIKPENIIYHNGVCILTDFGDATSDGAASGYTPAYAAPELLNNRISMSASDYYSFGVMLYVLFTGFNPFENVGKESFEKLKESSSWIEEDFLPPKAKELIDGLCDIDISRRWKYDRVSEWCSDAQNDPTGLIGTKYNGPFGTIMWDGRIYDSAKQRELINDMACKWKEGVKFLSSSESIIKAKAYSPMFYSAMKKALGYAQDYSELSLNVSFLEFITSMPFSLDGVYWRNYRFEDLCGLGLAILNDCFNLFAADKKTVRAGSLTDEIMRLGIASKYIKKSEDFTSEEKSDVNALEQKYCACAEYSQEKYKYAFRMGYLLSGTTILTVSGIKSVSTKSEFRDEFVRLLNTNDKARFNAFINYVSNEAGGLTIPMSIWLETNPE